MVNSNPSLNRLLFHSPNFSDLQPSTVINSTQNWGWHGLIIDERNQQPHDIEASCGQSEHLIVFFLADLPNLVQQRVGRIYERDVQTHNLSIVPAQMPQRWQWKSGVAKTLHLRIDPAFLISVAASIKGINLTTVELLNHFQFCDPQITNIAQSLRAELISNGLCGRMYTESLAHRLALHLLLYYSNLNLRVPQPAGRLSQSRLNLVLEYINEHLAEVISLADLASTIQVDTYWFAKMFQRSTGLAPHQYLIERRVEKAKTLLLSTDLSITEIAYQVGFADQAHLTRHFKRLIGTTPGAIDRRAYSKHMS